MYCEETWVFDEGGGGGDSGNPGIPGDSGGNGGGDGGGNGGNPDPCDGGGLIIYKLPPCDDGGGDPGWMPEIPEEPVSLINILDLKSADVNYTIWLNNNPEFSSLIYEELESDNFSPEAKAIAKIIIDQGANKLLEAEWGESFANIAYNHIQDYYNICCPGLLQPITGLGGLKWAAEMKADYAYLRLKNSGWSIPKCIWEATKESLHTALDVAGMVPVIGEIFDLTNGVLYALDGDGINASLSVASMLPIFGWAANGAKYVIKTNGLKYIVKSFDGVKLITFGGYNSKKFRRAIGLAKGDATKQAHHILPRASIITEHTVIQKATQVATNLGFHIDDVINGIAVSTWRNQPNHHIYSNKIMEKLNVFIQEFPNATNEQCYNKILSIISEAKSAIINNPNVHLNDLIF